MALESERIQGTRCSIQGPPETIRVGLLGCGHVGTEVARRLLADGGFVGRGSDEHFELARVAVRHRSKRRPIDLPGEIITTDAISVVEDPSIDVIIELIGGIDLPHELIRRALAFGKSVITANKEVIALFGPDLATAAQVNRASLLFEGAVGGATPAVHVIKESLAGDRIHRITGVLNGTTNYVLERLGQGDSLDGAIAKAQALGFAERDPSADLSGTDAACKLAILASLAFEHPVPLNAVHVRGIEDITTADLEAARRLGYVVKLLATAESFSGCLELRVEPTAVPEEDPIARVTGADNLVLIESELSGRLTIAGPGAGGRETASAVLGDLVRSSAVSAPPAFEPRTDVRLSSVRDVPAGYLVRCDAEPDGELEPAIKGRLFGHGVDVDGFKSFTTTDSGQVAFEVEFSEEGCIRRALEGLPGLSEHETSLIKVHPGNRAVR